MEIEAEQSAETQNSDGENSPDTSEDQSTEVLNTEQTEGDESDDEFEEELEEGLKVRGKKDAIEKLRAERLMQADYTRKTQEVAETRKAFEAQKQQAEELFKFQAEVLDDVAHVKAINNQLAKFERLDWQKLAADDPQRALQLDIERRQLLDLRNQVGNVIAQKKAKFDEGQRETRAKQSEERSKFLAKNVPGWGADMDVKLTNYALEKGYTAEFLASHSYPPQFVVDLYNSWNASEAKKRAQAKQKTPEPTPVTRVTASKSRASVDPDKMNPEQWLKWRNEQLRKR